MAIGRAGPSVLLTPDSNVGAELAAGGAWFATTGLGLSSELVFDLFYGAATYERTATAYPVLSLQLAVVVDVEVLP
jgi:hypothetical protein